MAQAARAYQEAYQQPQRRSRELERPARPPLYVIPGKGLSPAAQPGLSAMQKMLFAVGIVAVVLIGLVCLARVGLAGSTMELLADSAQVSQSIGDARSQGTQLEVQYAKATSTPAVQEAAARLGMGPSPQVEYLKIPTEE